LWVVPLLASGTETAHTPCPWVTPAVNPLASLIRDIYITP
jgi:hypothetical protein